MTDKELIQVFRECEAHPNCIGCKYDRDEEECIVGTFTLEELVARLDVLLDENARLKAQTHEWVRVEDGLPLWVGDYLCMLAGTREMAVLFFDTHPVAWEDSDGVEYAVTHWRPLPWPPSTEGVE